MIDLQDYTADILLDAMLSRISDDVDKREGSIIYDALAPVAHEVADLYKILNDAYEDSFVGTALGDALDLRGAEMGIYRRTAVKALRKARFYGADDVPFNVDIGMRFASLEASEVRNFSVFEKLETGVFSLEADEGGADANQYIGPLSPVQYVEGLIRCEMIEEPILDGTDPESDEDFRSRYLYKIKNDPADGNVAQYLQWALEYPGIGKVKVFPRWNGVNTVKVSILASDNMPCNADLVAAFQNYLDPKGDGLGNGMAPIGAKVTVATVALKNIDVTYTVALEKGKDPTQVSDLVKTVIRNYFDDISYKKSKVYYMEVGAAILSVAGVLSLSQLTLNGGIVDIPLGDEERPYLGTYIMEVGV